MPCHRSNHSTLSAHERDRFVELHARLGRLGAQRFFELYCETWRRSVLNLRGRKSWRQWALQVKPSDVPSLTRMLVRTQRMMRPSAYLAEHRLA